MALLVSSWSLSLTPACSRSTLHTISSAASSVIIPAPAAGREDVLQLLGELSRVLEVTCGEVCVCEVIPVMALILGLVWVPAKVISYLGVRVRLGMFCVITSSTTWEGSVCMLAWDIATGMVWVPNTVTSSLKTSVCVSFSSNFSC